jgi:hypothetical protein
VVDRPANCVVETGGVLNPTSGVVDTKELVSEIVESKVSGEPLIFFKSKAANNVIAEVLFLNKGTEECLFKNQLGKLTGSFLAEPLPQLTEELAGDWDFEAPTKEFFLVGGGVANKAGLSFAGEPATLSGLTLIILTSDEKFGAF